MMTTAIMANVRRGEFPQAMAWAIVLMGIALWSTLLLTMFQNGGSSMSDDLVPALPHPTDLGSARSAAKG